MHMKDDHTRNAQPKLGYNVQIGVDSEYIVAADIFQDRNDGWTLVPFLETMEKKVEFRFTHICGSRNRNHISNRRPMRNGKAQFQTGYQQTGKYGI